MSVDESIDRALRFKNSQTAAGQHLYSWKATSDFKLQTLGVTVRVAEHKHSRIYTFEAELKKKRCVVSNLIQAQHNRMKQPKKLDKSIFMQQQLHQLGWMTPIYLSTKEIICFKSGESSLAVVRLSHPDQNAASLNTYLNTWETFVELYQCMPNCIRFCCVLQVDGGKGWLESRLFPMFVEEAITGIVKQLHAIQDAPEPVLIEPRVIRVPPVQPRRDDPCWSQQHLRLPKCSAAERAVVMQMKQRFPDAVDNTLIRYLMSKEWKLQQACTAYSECLLWKEEMKKYSMDDFKSLMQKKMFTYIGKDRMGRPVVYNKASAVIPDELDEELYIIFYSYFFEIYIASKMEGYVDKILVIADGEDLGFKNFKPSLTSKNLEGLLKYCPERQSRLIAVHANFFGRTVWKILKPLLPTKTLDKIQVLGFDQQEILGVLLKEMDISVIPQCLGGTNKNMWADCC